MRARTDVIPRPAVQKSDDIPARREPRAEADCVAQAAVFLK
jgi:hypothetical protein